MDETLSPQMFDLPDFKLPAYEDFTRNVDTVFDRDGDRYVPKKPTITDDLNYFSQQNSRKPNTSFEIGQYSKAQSEPFTNPNLPFDPNVNMEEIYAKYDPVTFGDSFEKAWDIAKINLFNGTKNLWTGITEGISEGNVNALADNSYSRHLSDMVENLDKIKPMFFTEEEKETNSAFLKQLFPSAGYIASGLVEMVGTHAVGLVGGAVGGAIVGEGVGAIPGAIAGTGAAFVRDAKILKNMLTGMSNMSRTINTLGTAGKIKQGAQLLGHGLLFANGEAALSAVDAKKSYIESKKREYYKRTGNYLGGDELKKEEEQGDKVASATFAMNLPLIMASNLMQFSNLIRGSVRPRILDELAVGFDKAGKAYAKDAILKVGGRFAKETLSEGLEEFGQGVIQDSSTEYFNTKRSNQRDFLSTFVESAYKRAGTKEGRQEFLGGVILGGAFNSLDLGGYSAVKANTENYVKNYNTSTSLYFDQLGRQVRLETDLKDALKSGDNQTVQDKLKNGLIDLVNVQSKLGSTGAFSETLDSMVDMDIQEFNNMFGLSLSEGEQRNLIQGLRQEYDNVVKIRENVDNIYTVNPFGNDAWYDSFLNKFKTEPNTDRKASRQVWEVFKDTVTKNAVLYDDSLKRLENLEAVVPSFPGVENMVGTDINKVVSNNIQRLRLEVSANLPGNSESKRLLDALESETDVKKQYKLILNSIESNNPGATVLLKALNTEIAQNRLLLNESKRLNSRTGQKKEIKKILDLLMAYETVIATPTPATATPALTPSPATPTPATPVTTAPSAATPSPAAPVAPSTTPVTPVSEPVLDIIDDDPSIDDYASQFGEGDTEETQVERSQIKKKEPKEPKKKEPKKKEPEIIDTSIEDEEIQVNEVNLNERLSGMDDGETVVPDELGVAVDTFIPETDGWEPVEKYTKEDGKVVAHTPNRKVTTPKTPLAASRTRVNTSDLNKFLEQNNLNEQSDEYLILKNLLLKHATLKC